MSKIWPWVGIPLGIGVLLLLLVFWTSEGAGDRSGKNNDVKIGSGRMAKLGDKVAVHFTISLQNKVVADTREQGVPEQLVLEKKRGTTDRKDRMYNLMVDKIVGMKEGGLRRFAASPEANAGIIEIELLKVESR